MVTTPTAPMPVRTGTSPASAAVMFAPEIDELEAKLPEPILKALVAISQQMETEIYEPLLHARGFEDLREQFAHRFQPFSNLQCSVSSLLSSVLDTPDLAHFWYPIFTKMKAEIESHGAETIGKEAADDMVVGLAATGLVFRRLIGLAQGGQELSAEEENVQELLSWNTAYWMAASCVYHYHFNTKGVLQNVRLLAYWSRYYAAGVYHSAKTLGVIKVPVSKGRVRKLLEEDRILSEAGLNDFVDLLARDDAGRR